MTHDPLVDITVKPVLHICISLCLKMGQMSTLIICICFSCLRSVALCTIAEGEVFSFIGCNVTMEWNLGNMSFPHETIKIQVVEPNGHIIIQADKDNCSSRNQSVKCAVSAHDNELTFSLIIVNARTNHSGNYTVWYKQGLSSINITKQLVIQASSSPGPNDGNKPMPHDLNGLPLQLLGVGLVIVAVCLIIVGVLILVTHRRKHASRALGSSAVHQPKAEPSNREVPRDLLSFDNHDRPLTAPTVQDNACQRIRRPVYPNVKRKSRSLRTLMDHTQDFWNPVRQTVSLQTLIQLSRVIKRRSQSDDSLSKTCCSKTDSLSSMEGSANEIRLEELYSRVRQDNKVSYDEKNTGARSLSPNNFRPQSFDQQPQEDQYSTIDEDIVSVYHCVKANKHDENLQEDSRNTEAGNNDYDYATLPAL